MRLSRSPSRPLIAACFCPICPSLHPASRLQFQPHLLNRRLSSSKILAATGTASLSKGGAAGSSGHGGHILTPTLSENFSTHSPIGSSGGNTISTNAEPRPNGSGTCTILFKGGPQSHWTRSFHQGIAANNSALPGSGAAKARRAEEKFSRASLAHGDNLQRDGSEISCDVDDFERISSKSLSLVLILQPVEIIFFVCKIL
ncbi:hypothetical protein EDC01DRAFT_227895 [Geopyxis carbonaria]|nr:hypothetical protein EDC01DRAFT_227895 [Geopyxis carbonaria]